MSEDVVLLRAAAPADAAALGVLHVETWRAAYAGMLPDNYLSGLSVPERQRFWARTLQAPPGRETVLVAETGRSGVVGFGSCGRRRRGGSVAGAWDALDGEVYTLYVDIDHQGRGIGRRLLASLFRVLRRQGIAGALIWVLAPNPARFFYQAMGGILMGEKNERFAGIEVTELGYGWPDLADAIPRLTGRRAGGSGTTAEKP